ncbi:hypothetical protein NGA_0646300 [Nannochloropsis gaditana CCMP526]|nr:hypothetical protein NGA_0646300 [Nannochloropsis gaditana CCMP526]EKU20714.1 hypothetical protein NGA_0646300 [Nannochloropsis gaditana CCMP526]|eukprot:XP_005855648.1 hypothetical protein NGA_0646300 [Nannochloropsis gaditana CCMP526]
MLRTLRKKKRLTWGACVRF